jgi:hypothetical protein
MALAATGLGTVEKKVYFLKKKFFQLGKSF